MKKWSAFLAFLACISTAGAQTYTVLKSFNPGENMGGMSPQGTLVQGPDGFLYGVTTAGGAGGAGCVFRVQTDGTGFVVLHDFSTLSSYTLTNIDGAKPQAGLALSGGTLYGTAGYGGSGGNGTIFSLGTNGANFTVLKSFSAYPQYLVTNFDGATPAAALLVTNGVIYGTALDGGFWGNGTIFQLSTNGASFTNLYNFTGDNDGANPQASLLLSGGVFYGETDNGGAEGNGTVFSFTPGGAVLNPIYAFNGTGIDGATPSGGLVLIGGMLYGTTQFGDSGSGDNEGTVFGLSLDGSIFTNLYSFSGSDGNNPEWELIASGNTLYGTTVDGGFYNGASSFYGTVFQINTDSTGFSTIASFNLVDGAGLQCGLVLSDGYLYGISFDGGVLGNTLAGGTVFALNLQDPIPVDLVTFGSASGAINPDTGLTLSDGVLFGTVLGGGTNGSGALFEIQTNGTGFADVHDFGPQDNNGDNADGTSPRAVMVVSGGAMYGDTRYGGTNGQGTVFKLNLDGTGFTNLYNFSDAEPDTPITPLAISGSIMYGTTPQGGPGFAGTIFQITTNGTGFTNFIPFSGTGDSGPAGVVQSGNYLYGAAAGGSSGNGVIFRVATDGTQFTNLYTFTALQSGINTDGAYPQYPILLTNNVIYGTTVAGGPAGLGTIFKLNTDGTGFTTLLGCTISNEIPGTLILSGNMLYGASYYGGISNAGTIFQLDTSGNNFSVLKQFTGQADGANPATPLVLYGNTLYGTTFSGGLANFYGTVFSLTLSSSAVTPIPLMIRGIGNAVVLTWNGPAFALQSAPLVTGVYTNIPNATSPYTNAITGKERFFRLQAN
jgi:uncharacterized repeat protein (TIGR03803 family)